MRFIVFRKTFSPDINHRWDPRVVDLEVKEGSIEGFGSQPVMIGLGRHGSIIFRTGSDLWKAIPVDQVAAHLEETWKHARQAAEAHRTYCGGPPLKWIDHGMLASEYDALTTCCKDNDIPFASKIDSILQNCITHGIL